MTLDARQRWFAQMLEAGLGENILQPKDVLQHATPDVLANNLPPELMSKMLQAFLEAGSMTPESVVQTVTPSVLAEHIPHDVLWACIADAAERAGLTREEPIARSRFDDRTGSLRDSFDDREDRIGSTRLDDVK